MGGNYRFSFRSTRTLLHANGNWSRTKIFKSCHVKHGILEIVPCPALSMIIIFLRTQYPCGVGRFLVARLDENGRLRNADLGTQRDYHAIWKPDHLTPWCQIGLLKYNSKTLAHNCSPWRVILSIYPLNIWMGQQQSKSKYKKTKKREQHCFDDGIFDGM